MSKQRGRTDRFMLVLEEPEVIAENHRSYINDGTRRYVDLTDSTVSEIFTSFDGIPSLHLNGTLQARQSLNAFGMTFYANSEAALLAKALDKRLVLYSSSEVLALRRLVDAMLYGDMGLLHIEG